MKSKKLLLCLVLLSWLWLCISISQAAPSVVASNSLPQVLKEGVVKIDDQTQTIYKLPDFFTYTFTAITVLVSVVTIVLGGLLAVNFVGARDVVKRAEAELQTLILTRTNCEKEVGDLKRLFATHLDAKTKEFLIQANEQVRKSISNHYEAVVIPKIKQELIELLAVDPVSPKDVFPKLTDVLNYPDDLSLKIYTLCLEKCCGNEDITKKVNQGLTICAARLGGKSFSNNQTSFGAEAATLGGS